MTENKDRVFEGRQYGQQIMDQLFEETTTVETFGPGVSKDKYIQKLDIKVEKLKTMIDDMIDKSRNLEKDVRTEFEKDIKKAQLCYDEAKSRLSDTRQAGEEAWQELHNGASTAVKDLTEGIKNAISKFQ